MKYDFDKVPDRSNTSSVKWGELENLYGSKDLIPMWVADMDFPCPAPVVDALTKRAEHGIYGYTTRSDSYLESVCEWMNKRHNWHVEKEWVCHSPGVVPAISFIVNAFTNPGDRVIIQPPVYYPFTHMVEKSGREVVHNPLVFEDGRYAMDFDDLREKAKDGAKMLVLCSPHNPVGRVWSKEELHELGQICHEHGVLVVSDEIHFDLIYKPHTHIPFASLSEDFAMNAIICTAPSKTFNLAGLQTSNMIIPNPDLRQRYTDFVQRLGLSLGNTFGLLALETAYRHGDEWLDQLLDYLQDNLNYLTDYVNQNIPGIKVIAPEGTYLVWLDCRDLQMGARELAQLMRQDARVALDDGHIFGPGGEGFERINIACPRRILEEGLRRIELAVHHLPVR